MLDGSGLPRRRPRNLAGRRPIRRLIDGGDASGSNRPRASGVAFPHRRGPSAHIPGSSALRGERTHRLKPQPDGRVPGSGGLEHRLNPPRAVRLLSDPEVTRSRAK